MYNYDSYLQDLHDEFYAEEKDAIYGVQLQNIRELYIDLVDFTGQKPDDWALDEIEAKLKSMGDLLGMRFSRSA